MVDADRIVELVPHFLAMLVLIFVVRTVAGVMGFWIELVTVLAVAIAYPLIVMRLDMAPSSWE